MAFDLSKEIVIKGIGNGYMNTVSNKFVEIIHGQTMKLDVKSTMTDVDGGSSLFPIYTFISKKEGSIEIDTATFSAMQAGIQQAVTTSTTGVKALNRMIVKSTELSLGTVTGVTEVKCKAPDGTLIPVELGSGTVAATGVKVTSAGVLTWGASAVVGEYVFWFKADAMDAVEMQMLKNAMPEVAEFAWSQTSEALDGGTYKIDVYAKRTRADGGYTLDLANDKATVNKLKLSILDPGDGREDFCTIVVSKIA